MGRNLCSKEIAFGKSQNLRIIVNHMNCLVLVAELGELVLERDMGLTEVLWHG